MSEKMHLSKALNPCIFHLQKMQIELKCAICLNMLSQPLSLPCSHIFCSPCVIRLTKSQLNCPVCEEPYSWQELHPAPHMEQMVNIYKGMDAAFAAALSQSKLWDNCSDVKVVCDGNDTIIEEKTNAVSRYESSKSPQVDHRSGMKSITKLYPATKRVQVSPDIENAISAYDAGKKVPVLNYEEKNNKFTRPSSKNVGTNIDPRLQRGKQVDVDTEVTKMQGDVVVRLHHENHKFYGQHLIKNGEECYKRLLENVPNDRLSKKQNISNSGFGNIGLEGQLTHFNNVCSAVVENDAKEEAMTQSNSYSIASTNIIPLGTSVNLHGSSDLNLNSSTMLINRAASCDGHLERQLTAAGTHSKSDHFEGIFQPGAKSSTGAVYSSSQNVICAFCQSSRDSEASGPLLHYLKGKAVAILQTDQPGVVHAHEKCIEWAPKAYYEDENVQNLEDEVARSSKIKCSKCGEKGAALGCYAKSCRRSFHVPCAADIPGCRWDGERYLMLCPIHSSLRFPGEKSKSKKKSRIQLEPSSFLKADQQNKECIDTCGRSDKWVLCGSALTSSEKEIVMEFASLTGVAVSRSWDSSVTHVIASVDDNGCCSRTLKVLMAILTGKWILNINWLKACMEAKLPVSEEPYEIQRDIHGCYEGPRRGRIRTIAKEPPLFNGLNFYFIGEFEGSYRRYLEDLVLAAGGTALKTLPDSLASSEGRSCSPSIIIVYYVDRTKGVPVPEGGAMEQIVREANSVAAKLGARVIGHERLLDSIAACSLQLLATVDSM